MNMEKYTYTLRIFITVSKRKRICDNTTRTDGYSMPKHFASKIVKCTYFIITISGVRLSPLGTAATTGILYQPQMIVEHLVE
jgi:hypothetical protein